MFILDFLLVINYYVYKIVFIDIVDVSEFYKKKKINDKKDIGIIIFYMFNYFFFIDILCNN